MGHPTSHLITVPALTHHVSVVVCHRAQPQVLGTTALGVVATVQHQSAHGYRTMGKMPSESVGSPVSLLVVELSITVPVKGLTVGPAFRTLVHVSPEILFSVCGTHAHIVTGGGW